MESGLFHGENQISGCFFTSIVLRCNERPQAALRIVLLPSNMPGTIEINPDDWVAVSENYVYDLTRYFPKCYPLGLIGKWLFPHPVINWDGIAWMLFAAFLYWPFGLLFPIALIAVEEWKHQDSLSVKRKEFFILLTGTFFVTIFAEVLINQYLIPILRPDVPALVAEAMKTFIYTNKLRPNPGLIIRYTASLAALPFLLAVGYGLTQTLLNRFRRYQSGLNQLFLAAVFFGIVFPLLMLESWITNIHDILVLVLFRLSALIVIVFFVGAMIWNSKRTRRLLTSIGAGLIAVFLVHVFLLRLHSESFPPEAMHFDCVYFSVTQTVIGKTPFIDVHSLYGGFAAFLEPILRITGYGIFPFTFLMSILSVLSLVFLFLALRLIIRDRLLLVFGGLYLFFYVYVFQYFWNGALPGPVMYAQQMYLMRFPLRTLTVFAALFLMLLYFKRRTPLIYWAVLVLVFLAPFWNLDTGIILPIVWILSVLVDEYLRQASLNEFGKAALRHLGVFLAFAVAVPLLFTLYLFLRSGHCPDYFQMFRFLKSHAVAGFFAVPMPERHPVIIALLIEAAGLFYVLRCVTNNVTKRHAGYTARVVCVLSLLGFGLFPYFVNRSQNMNLFMVSFPAPMLVLLILDRFRYRFMQDIAARRLTLTVAGYSVSLVLFLCCFSFCIDMTPGCLSAAKTNLRLLIYPDKDYAPASVEGVLPHSVATERANIDFVRRLTAPGESILILSENYDAFYYGTSRTRSVLDLPSTVEWSRHDEMDLLKAFLEENDTVQVFIEDDNIPPFLLNREIAKEIDALLREHYEITDRSSAPGTLSLVRKKLIL